MQGLDGARPRTRQALAALVALGLVFTSACGGDDADSAGGGGGAAGESGTTAGGSDDVLGPVDQAEGEPVLIGFVSDGQAEAADQSIELEVADAAVDYVNEHRGGIAGRPIELATCETALDPAKATDCANQMIEQDAVAVLIGSSGVLEDIWRPLQQAGTPTVLFAASSGPVLEDDQTTFVLSNPQGGLIQVPIDLAVGDGADKVTAVVIDVPPAVEGLENSRTLFDDAGLDLELVRVPPGTADMTSQLGPVVSDDPGVVLILGNDSFCISAFQGLEALGFDGTISAITQCITDATRTALPAGSLEGLVVGSPVPVGIEDESSELFRTVADTYGDDIDTTRIAGVGAFVAVAGLAAGLEGLAAGDDVTPESITAALKSMPDTELPGAGGLHFRCDGSASPDQPALCTPGSLTTTLDADGRPTTYEPTDPASAEG